LSGGEQGFNGFVGENEECGDGLKTLRQRLVAPGPVDAADDLFPAQLLQIISSLAGPVVALTVVAEAADASCQLGGGEAIGRSR
jgi:hypothetical protein